MRHTYTISKRCVSVYVFVAAQTVLALWIRLVFSCYFFHSFFSVFFCRSLFCLREIYTLNYNGHDTSCHERQTFRERPNEKSSSGTINSCCFVFFFNVCANASFSWCRFSTYLDSYIHSYLIHILLYSHTHTCHRGAHSITVRMGFHDRNDLFMNEETIQILININWHLTTIWTKRECEQKKTKIGLKLRFVYFIIILWFIEYFATL